LNNILLNVKRIEGSIDNYLSESKEILKQRIKEYYELKKDDIETVVLKDLNDPSKNVTKKINTNIEFENTKDGNFEFYFVFEKSIEEKIYRAQQTGTAISIDKEILDYFEIDTEGLTSLQLRDVMENKYFDPKGQLISFPNDLRYLLNANKDLR
jgi:pantothenate kinase